MPRTLNTTIVVFHCIRFGAFLPFHSLGKRWLLGEDIEMVVLEFQTSQDMQKRVKRVHKIFQISPGKWKENEKDKLLAQSLLLRRVMCTLLYNRLPKTLNGFLTLSLSSSNSIFLLLGYLIQWIRVLVFWCLGIEHRT